jgi:hypothetical protein
MSYAIGIFDKIGYTVPNEGTISHLATRQPTGRQEVALVRVVPLDTCKQAGRRETRYVPNQYGETRN